MSIKVICPNTQGVEPITVTPEDSKLTEGLHISPEGVKRVGVLAYACCHCEDVHQIHPESVFIDILKHQGWKTEPVGRGLLVDELPDSNGKDGILGLQEIANLVMLDPETNPVLARRLRSGLIGGVFLPPAPK